MIPYDDSFPKTIGTFAHEEGTEMCASCGRPISFIKQACLYRIDDIQGKMRDNSHATPLGHYDSCAWAKRRVEELTEPEPLYAFVKPLTARRALILE